MKFITVAAILIIICILVILSLVGVYYWKKGQVKKQFEDYTKLTTCTTVNGVPKNERLERMDADWPADFNKEGVKEFLQDNIENMDTKYTMRVKAFYACRAAKYTKGDVMKTYDLAMETMKTMGLDMDDITPDYELTDAQRLQFHQALTDNGLNHMINPIPEEEKLWEEELLDIAMAPFNDAMETHLDSLENSEYTVKQDTVCGGLTDEGIGDVIPWPPSSGEQFATDVSPCIAACNANDECVGFNTFVGQETCNLQKTCTQKYIPPVSVPVPDTEREVHMRVHYAEKP
tara:strand:+ start:3117 stop:3983 length:867 start_codon:yes stop_codon:yes gene_type:complete